MAVATIWDPVLGSDFAGRALFDHPSEADGYLALLEPLARMYFLSHGLREAYARARARGTDVLLLNAYWYKYYATEVAHGGDPAALRTVTSVMPEPDVTFYLRISPAEAARRKGRFSAYETGFAETRSAADFERFQAPALRELEALGGELGWTVLDNETPGTEHAGAIADRLAALDGGA